MDWREVQRELNDPYSVCAALGLCPGPGVRERGEWWYERRPNVTIKCPWHDGRSCYVHTHADGIGFTCFGCGEKGSVFKLVAKANNLDVDQDFARVLDVAASLAGVRLDPPEGTEVTMGGRTEGDDRLDAVTFGEFAETLLTSGLTSLERHEDRDALCSCGCVEARRYLEDRCILAGALRDGWRHIPTSWQDQNLLRDLLIEHHGVDAWRRSGLAQHQNPTRWFYAQNRLVIPWRGMDGRVWQVQRRLMRDPKPDTREVKYLSAATRERSAAQPYGVHRLVDDGAPIAFVEGAFDSLSLESIFHDGDDAATPWVVLGLPGVGVWRTSWASLATGRTAVVALDREVKIGAEKGVNAARQKMLRDLAPVAAELSDATPELDGEAMHDWNDVWRAAC